MEEISIVDADWKGELELQALQCGSHINPFYVFLGNRLANLELDMSRPLWNYRAGSFQYMLETLATRRMWV